jgi:hypothetical protein
MKFTWEFEGSANFGSRFTFRTHLQASKERHCSLENQTRNVDEEIKLESFLKLLQKTENLDTWKLSWENFKPTHSSSFTCSSVIVFIRLEIFSSFRFFLFLFASSPRFSISSSRVSNCPKAFSIKKTVRKLEI